ncbi:MAG: type II toxin-antitoxin system prevent-host-death family antitoxin [Alcanivorax sp.]|nr:type II toxin-antitoxin system prevent-host-death family antitoxin [Alcanivorax sp.]
MATQTAFDELDRRPASDLKRAGWRDVMRSVREQGRLLVTNHNQPEAVILSAEAYSELMQLLERAGGTQASALEQLRQRFDTHLAGLKQTDAGDRLRALMDDPATLSGNVGAGESY